MYNIYYLYILSKEISKSIRKLLGINRGKIWTTQNLNVIKFIMEFLR